MQADSTCFWACSAASASRAAAASSKVSAAVLGAPGASQIDLEAHLVVLLDEIHHSALRREPGDVRHREHTLAAHRLEDLGDALGLRGGDEQDLAVARVADPPHEADEHLAAVD